MQVERDDKGGGPNLGDPLVQKKVRETIGPYPRHALRAMVDYGLNDEEIGRYYRLNAVLITRLRHSLCVMRDD